MNLITTNDNDKTCPILHIDMETSTDVPPTYGIRVQVSAALSCDG